PRPVQEALPSTCRRCRYPVGSVLAGRERSQQAAPGLHDFIRKWAPFGDQCIEMIAIGAIVCDGKPSERGAPSVAPLRIKKQIVGQQCIELGIQVTRDDRELSERELIRQRLDNEIQADEDIVPIEGDEQPLYSFAQSLPLRQLLPRNPFTLAEQTLRKCAIELFGSISHTLHATELITGLEGCAIADIGRGRHLLQIG